MTQASICIEVRAKIPLMCIQPQGDPNTNGTPEIIML